MTKLSRKLFFGFCSTLVLGLNGALPSVADVLRTETAGVGGGAYLATIGIAALTERHTDHSMEVTADQNGARSMVSLGRGKIDMAFLILAQYISMRDQTDRFATVADAPEAASHLRAIFGFPGGAYQMVVWESSGIRSLSEARGRNVFLGPRNSAAETYGIELIRGETGMEPGIDYELVNLDFRGGEQAFLDGQVDFYMRTAPVGGSIVEQLGVIHPIRLLGFSKEGVNSLDTQRVAQMPGRGLTIIPVGTYTGQANEEPVVTFGFSLGLGVHNTVSEETIYDITRAFVMNIVEFRETAPHHFATVTRENLFESLNVPLHMGAYRYYTEVGIAVPEALIPAEAR